MAKPQEIGLSGRTLPVVIRRHATARQMTMRLAPDGSEVRVSIPRWGRVGEALTFAKARRDWLEARLAELPVQPQIVPGITVPYRGQSLTLIHDAKAARRPLLVDDALVIGGPPEQLGKRLQGWLESEARRLVAEDLTYYCARADKPLPSLSLSRAQRRWGSCAHSGAIRINWRLIMANDNVRRSVVAHEVAHLTHFDHSPRFYALLDRIYDGDMEAANRWLKREGRSLYTLLG